MNILGKMAASGPFESAHCCVLAPPPADLVGDAVARGLPAAAPCGACPVAVQHPVQSVSSLQSLAILPAIRGYAVQLCSAGVGWHGHEGVTRMGFSGASPGQMNGLVHQACSGCGEHFPSSISAYGLYPGVQLDYSLDLMRYDLHFAPAVSTVALQFTGVEPIGLTDNGALRVRGPAGTVLQHPPRCCLESAEGSKPVPGRFVLLGEDRAGFVVEDRALHHALVVSPTVDYISTVPLSLQEPCLSVVEDSADRVWAEA